MVLKRDVVMFSTHSVRLTSFESVSRRLGRRESPLKMRSDV
jgi:hypothetical protein